MNSKELYRWTAKNNGSFLNGYREAKTLLGAVRAGRAYVNGELNGRGKVVIEGTLNGENWYPIRVDECSIYTNFEWRTSL